MDDKQERRKPFEGYYGCLKTKRGEFCSECVTQAAGEYIKYDRRKQCQTQIQSLLTSKEN